MKLNTMSTDELIYWIRTADNVNAQLALPINEETDSDKLEWEYVTLLQLAQEAATRLGSLHDKTFEGTMKRLNDAVRKLWNEVKEVFGIQKGTL